MRSSREALGKIKFHLNEISGWSSFPGREGHRKIFITRVVATENISSSQLPGPFLCMSFFGTQVYCASININIRKYINMINI